MKCQQIIAMVSNSQNPTWITNFLFILKYWHTFDFHYITFIKVNYFRYL